MSQIGKPVRKVEYAPLEDPVPPKREKEKPKRAPERVSNPIKEPEKEPAPARGLGRPA